MADMSLQQDAVSHDGHSTEEHNENMKFAVWLFLGSEVVLFTMLIAAYAIFRATQPAAVDLVHDSLGITLVTINTFILLASSYAMVMGLRAIEMGKKQQFYQWIGLTAVLGIVFVGGQYIEYSELGHLQVSLNQQEFTVATNLFEEVNEVEAILTTSTVAVASNEVLNTETELVEVRHHDVPEDGTVIASTDDTTTTVAITGYVVDFVDDAKIFEGVNLADFQLRVQDSFILLDAEGNPVTDPDLFEDVILDYYMANNEDVNEAQARRAVFDEPVIGLDRVALTDTEGNIVLFSDIVAGQEVELDTAQYDTLNEYFRSLLGNSASNYGMRFYAPTAFHGAHVIVGVLWAFWVLWSGYRGNYDNDAIGVEIFGLYWHFVDVVWIGLFTIIYLV